MPGGIEELIPGILNITDAAIKHDFDIGSVLTLFENDISKALEYYKQKRTKKAFFSMAIALGLISVIVVPVVPSTPGVITANHGAEH